VCCGRIPVAPGDWVVGDADGVVVMPSELRPQVLTQASQVRAREVALAGHLRQGKSFAEALAAMAAEPQG
jgi:4-hydroxy-4-methyl-2-oxoglutarate aldolase